MVVLREKVFPELETFSGNGTISTIETVTFPIPILSNEPKFIEELLVRIENDIRKQGAVPLRIVVDKEDAGFGQVKYTTEVWAGESGVIQQAAGVGVVRREANPLAIILIAAIAAVVVVWGLVIISNNVTKTVDTVFTKGGPIVTAGIGIGTILLGLAAVGIVGFLLIRQLGQQREIFIPKIARPVPEAVAGIPAI